MLNYNEFLVTYHHNKNYYFKVFDRLGNLKISQTQINDNLDQFTKYGTFTINDNDVVFVWSDSRNEQKGYDIFAKSIKKNIITAINEKEGEVYPSNFSLSQNYPNPFNPTTKIKFSTSPFNPSPYQGEGNRERLVTLKVYDILGNEIATLVDEKKPPGNYEVEFDAGGLASGTYIYQLKAGEFTKAKKLLLLK
ncbi:MAG: T9SS type A sorting domain-containing protein [Ignavibacteriae bacterium]|nr:T9SS C-terminal target domain-containing protein [Ignavibacteriota bacterium]NOG99347.1 T9SS type A sorting domain-containing protein [Ignavibacteriota bacterium]